MECGNPPKTMNPLGDRRGYNKHTLAMTGSGRKQENGIPFLFWRVLLEEPVQDTKLGFQGGALLRLKLRESKHWNRDQFYISISAHLLCI